MEIEKEIEVEEVGITMTKDPDPNCKDCSGTGLWHRTKMICPCRAEFLPPVKKMMKVRIEIGN